MLLLYCEIPAEYCANITTMRCFLLTLATMLVWAIASNDIVATAAPLGQPHSSGLLGLSKTAERVRDASQDASHASVQKQQAVGITIAASNSLAQYAAPVAFAKQVTKKHGFAYLVFLNAAYLDITESWVCNVKALGNVLPNTAFVCGDANTTKALLDFDPSLHAFTHSYAQKGGVTYGTYEYFRLTVERLLVQNAMIQQGVSIMVVEADAAWLPRAADMQAKINELLQTHEILSANDGEKAKQISAGFLAIRSTSKMRAFFQKYVDFYVQHLENAKKRAGAREQIGHVGEQVTMTSMLKDGNVSVKWLSDCTFSASGKWYTNSAYRKRCKNLRVVQNNFIKGNDLKRQRAKRFKHWYMDEGGRCTRGGGQNTYIVKSKQSKNREF
eukprot:COSAG01_NODE_6404_length_3685_cov_14.157278_4_plen_386_part_00